MNNFRPKFLRRRVSTTIPEVYPHSLLMVEQSDGHIILYKTDNDKFSMHFDNLICYNNSYNIKTEDHILHFLNYREVTTEKPIARLISYYKNISRVFLLRVPVSEVIL